MNYDLSAYSFPGNTVSRYDQVHVQYAGRWGSVNICDGFFSEDGLVQLDWKGMPYQDGGWEFYTTFDHQIKVFMMEIARFGRAQEGSAGK